MRSGIRAAVIAGLLAAASLTINATPQSESGEIQLQLARQFLADGRYQDLLEAFRRVFTARGLSQPRASVHIVPVAPADPEAASLYGDSLWAAGLFEEAEAQYRLALKSTPDLP